MIPVSHTVEATELDRAQLAALPHQSPQNADEYAKGFVRKPWGYEYEIYANSQESCWQLHLSPNSETSLHCHPGHETMLIVVGGVVQLFTLAGIYSLRAGERALIAPGAFHKTATSDGAILIEIESPPDKADIVRLSDKYGRAA